MNHNTLELMRQSKTIAQSVAPFDTGNLRYNAIRAYQTPKGFRIVWGNFERIWGSWWRDTQRMVEYKCIYES